ncbi:MAG TPA: SH3 domain-containing protein, partial [Spirochaetes bacterium]|nr:SH3 domain-containing protein [Spirochaetota bacterium]
MKTLLLIVQLIVIMATITCERSEKRRDTGIAEGIEKAYQMSQSSDTPESSKNANSTDQSKSPKDKANTDQSVENNRERYRITASTLILRDKPTRASKIITRIFRHDSVSLIEETSVIETIEGKKAHWFKVQIYDGTEGYVFAAFLEKVYKNQTSESNTWDIYQWYIIENHVRIREEPNVKAKITRVCKAGDSFHILQRTFKRVQIGEYKDYWYKMSFGWVYGAFITKDITRIKLPYIKSIPKSYESLVGLY